MLLRNNRCYERPSMNVEQSTTISAENSNMMSQDMGMGMGMMSGCPSSCVCPPVYECPQERVCHRQTVIEVPHIIPVNTRIINHQIYRHTYSPCFTACEETEVSNVYENNCCL